MRSAWDIWRADEIAVLCGLSRAACHAALAAQAWHATLGRVGPSTITIGLYRAWTGPKTQALDLLDIYRC